jgi:hypothetical protein
MLLCWQHGSFLSALQPTVAFSGAVTTAGVFD